MKVAQSVLFIVLILVSISTISLGRERIPKTEYIGWGFPRDGSGNVIAGVVDGVISPEFSGFDAPSEGARVHLFSIIEQFDGYFTLGRAGDPGDYDFISEPKGSYFFESIRNFPDTDDYPYNVLWWTGNPERIAPLEVKRNRETYAVLAEEYLLENLGNKGLAVTQDNVTQIWRIDLDGNGTEEAIYGIESSNISDPSEWIYGGCVMRHGFYTNEPGYSALLLRFIHKDDEVRTVPFYEVVYDEGDMKEFDHEKMGYGWLMKYYTLAGIIDLDDDGVYEIITSWSYFEGEGFNIWHFTGESIELVGGWGCGL